MYDIVKLLTSNIFWNSCTFFSYSWEFYLVLGLVGHPVGEAEGVQSGIQADASHAIVHGVGAFRVVDNNLCVMW